MSYKKQKQKQKLNSSLVIYLPIFAFSIVYLILNSQITVEVTPQSLLSKILVLSLVILSIVYYKRIGLFLYNQYYQLEDVMSGSSILKTINEIKRLTIKKLSEIPLEILKGKNINYWEDFKLILRDNLIEFRYQTEVMYKARTLSTSIYNQ